MARHRDVTYPRHLDSEKRDPYQVLGVSPDAPRGVVDREFRRRAVREHRLLEFDADAVRRLHELNEAYLALTRPPKLDRHGYAFVAIFGAVLLVGYLLDLDRRIFVYAPYILGLAGFFWVVDTLHRRATKPAKETPTEESVKRQTADLLGGPIEVPQIVAEVEPPAEGPYLAEALFVGDAEEPAAVIPAGSALPFDAEFVLSAVDDERSVSVPISARGHRLGQVRLHSLRPMRADDLLEVRVKVATDGHVTIEARDAHADTALRVEGASELLAPVAVAGYRA